MTMYYPDDMDEYGNYHYGYFDSYFTDSDRTAYLIYNDEVLVGFAMLNPYSFIEHQPEHVRIFCFSVIQEKSYCIQSSADDI